MGKSRNLGPCSICGCDLWSSKAQSKTHHECSTCGINCNAEWQRQQRQQRQQLQTPITDTRSQGSPEFAELLARLTALEHRVAAAASDDQPEVFDQTAFADGATVMLSDIHIPLHHRKATAAVINFCEANRDSGWLQRLVLCGDVFDGAGNSRHPAMKRVEFHGGDLGDEIETGRGTINALVDCFPDSVFMEGNHEARLWRQLAEKKGIPEKPIVFDALFDFYDYDKRLRVHHGRSLFIGRGAGELEFIHGERYNEHTAKALLVDNHFRNSAQGHTHRPQSHWSRGQFAIVNGHLHNIDKQIYMANPAWTLGFTIFEHWDNGRSVNPYFVRIKDDGSFAFAGKTYKG